jgi:hypothetical protein
MPLNYLPTLYKARRVPQKQPICAICIDRTRGRTTRVDLGYGVHVWLCAGHASVEFLTGRSGRDLVLTLIRTWQAQGCMTAARHKALNAHLASLKARPARRRPGSYAWPAVRVRAERLFAAGATHNHVMRRIDHATYGDATAPSPRTVRRWRTDHRWLTSDWLGRPAPPAAG